MTHQTPTILKFKPLNRFENLSGIDILGVDISELINYRHYLRRKGLIGTLTEGAFSGYDYGNLSIRVADAEKKFNMLISGSQTSGKEFVTLDDFTLVKNYVASEFSVYSVGMVVPSSETPMHWAAYEANRSIEAIIHAHICEYNPAYGRTWEFFEDNRLPMTTSPSKTKEIGLEIEKLIKEVGFDNVVGMLNHDGGFGLLSMGTNVEDSYNRLVGFYERLLELDTAKIQAQSFHP